MWSDDIKEGIYLPEGNIAGVLDSYKYLGIPQANGNHEVTARKSATNTQSEAGC